MYKATDQKIRGGGIQFSGYHPLKEVKFVGDEATGRHFLSKVQWPGDETDASWWRMWNVSSGRCMAFPMAPMMLIASSPRPPSVSATMGMKFIHL